MTFFRFTGKVLTDSKSKLVMSKNDITLVDVIREPLATDLVLSENT